MSVMESSTVAERRVEIDGQVDIVRIAITERREGEPGNFYLVYLEGSVDGQGAYQLAELPLSADGLARCISLANAVGQTVAPPTGDPPPEIIALLETHPFSEAECRRELAEFATPFTLATLDEPTVSDLAHSLFGQ